MREQKLSPMNDSRPSQRRQWFLSWSQLTCQ
jgi:hypothetical protein